MQVRKEHELAFWGLFVFVFTSESISRSPVSIHQASSTTGASTRHTTTVVIGLTATWKSSVLLGRLLVVTSHLMGLVLGTMVSANHYKRKTYIHTYVYTHTDIHKTRNKSDAKSNPQVYSCSQNTLPQFWNDSLSIQVFQRYRVHQVNCGALIRCS